MKRFLWFLLIFLGLPGLQTQAQTEPGQPHTVMPGDTWVALAWRYGVNQETLRGLNPHMNQQRQPTIGDTVWLPLQGVEQLGRLVRPAAGGLWETAVQFATSPWFLANQNGLLSPYRPLFHRPLFVPGGSEPPRDLPIGFATLELSQIPAHPGQALAFRTLTDAPIETTVKLDDLTGNVVGNGRYLVGLLATGAFFMGNNGLNIGKTAELAITPANSPAWFQPIRFSDNNWEFQQLTLTGSAAAIDQESIQQERERLFQIWTQITPTPQWNTPFQLPINDFLTISSPYGARRSYNGGPYRTYHEGLDFSAYAGTPVYAPAGGTVVLAEPLYVRGGAVILDHGLGIYSGYYHLSSVAATAGQVVHPGDFLGEVGTTGLSTGNHLHWDLLVAATWVDPAAWLEQDLACWILAGLGQPCKA